MIGIKEMNHEELVIKAKEIRNLLIRVVSRNGGHLAPNLGVVELTMAIHRVFQSPKDIILFDVGHQAYVHKILTGRKDKIETIRKKEGLSPFMDPHESIHDHFISGHAGTALSAACGIAKANPNKKIIVVIGDASICNGHSLEALNNMGDCDTKNIIVILNDNEMSIGKNVGTLSRFLGKIMTSNFYKGIRKDIRILINKGKIGGKITNTLERAENSVKQFLAPLSISELLGFKFYGTIDGHNFQELEENLLKAKLDEGPCFLHVRTQKGRGYSFAEKDSEKFHGISPFDLETGNVGKSIESYSTIFGDKIAELAEHDKDIYGISAAMVKGVSFNKFFEKYPERSKDVGISEGHAVTYSAGLAISGKKPYLALYSTFLQRGFSQLIHDIFLQNLSVRFMIDRAGIVGEDGKTHNGIYDIPIFLSVPNFMVFAPTTGEELIEIIEATKDIENRSIAIRYPRENAFSYKLPGKFQIGKWREVKSGRKTLIIATGTMFKEILNIEENLLKENIEPTIVSAASIKPLDKEYIKSEFIKYDNIIVAEESYKVNSFGSLLINYLNEIGIMKRIVIIAIENPNISHGSRDIIMREIGLRGESLVNKIKGSINAQ